MEPVMINIRRALGRKPKREYVDLLAHVVGKPREWILAHPEAIVRAPCVARFRRLLARLQRGEPLAQIIGEQWFYGRPFTVNRDVLIPRPETELLVELAIRECKMQNVECKIIDVGTGSGCVAVTIAAELPNASVTAIDSSAAALRIARKNAKRNNVSSRIKFIHGNILSRITDDVGLLPPSLLRSFGGTHRRGTPRNDKVIVIANLPYLTTSEWRALPRSLRAYEPRAAFDGGRDGLKPFRELFTQLDCLAGGDPPSHKATEGRSGTPPLRPITAILEIDPRRKLALAKLVRTILPAWHATWHRDLAKRWRVLELVNPDARE